MTTLEFRILGPLEVRTGSGDVLPLGRRKQRLLLAILLLDRVGAPTTDRLTDLLWGDQVPASGAANLYSYLSDLRRVLPPGRLDGHALDVRPGELDADRFTELTAEGLAALTEQRHDVAAERLTRALGLWRTRAIAEGLQLPAELRPAVARLERLRDQATEASFRARLALGEQAGIVAELEQLVARRPLDEPLWAILIQAQYQLGRRAEALDAYRRARKVLDDELGVEPGRELRDLHQRVLRSDPSLDGRATVPATAVTVPAQLPADLASFTGRRDEFEQLTELLGDDGAPTAVLITAIDGMAGIGKTALATHVAHRMGARFADGQLFLDLHGHTDGIEPVAPTDALDRMLRALGVRGEEIPPDLDSRTALFRTRIAGRRMLVVLDNAATESQVRPLLPGTPGCAVLITSRSVLSGLDDVSSVSLDPLRPPDATALFVRVAGEARLATEPADLLDEVVDLCGMLPLALRIAAGRLRARATWSLADLVARLRDEDNRLAELTLGERSVASSFGLSYQYLTADEQRIFRLLGLHPGGDLEPYAVAALADCSVELAEQHLEILLDAHLLMQRTPGRHVLHDLLRAHAASMARQTDPPDERRAAVGRLLDHYVDIAATAMDLLYPADRPDRPDVAPAGTPSPSLAGEEAARGWLDTELTNLLAAARHAADHGWPERAVQLAQMLAPHLRTRYDHDRALQLHTRARRCAVELGDQAAEFAALRALGDLHRTRTAYQEAGDYYREAIALADQLHDQVAVFAVMYGLGNLERLGGRVRSAITYHLEALRLAREAGQRGGEAQILNGLGVDYLAAGDHERAERCHCEALEVATEIGDRGQECLALGSVARVYKVTGRIDQAMANDQRALELAREMGDRRRELRAIMGLGEAHLATGRHAAALEVYQTTLKLARELGDTMHEVDALIYVGEAYDRMGEHGLAVEYQQKALDIAVRIDVPNFQFEASVSLCSSLRGHGRLEESLVHGTNAVQLARQLGQRHDEGRALSAVADTRAALGDRRRARDDWQQALRIFTELSAPERAQVAERLADGN